MDKKIKQQKKSELYLRVPGTSANLGPGFDLLGLALKIYNEFYFSFGDSENYELSFLDGSPLPFSTKENLIKDAYLKYFQLFLPDQIIIPFNVKMTLSLPLKGGLGSSASALVAGFKAAEYIHRKKFKKHKFPSKDQVLYEIAMMEGHPDNTTPAILGGFVFSYFTNNRLVYFKEKIPSNASLFLFIPDLQIETNDSRKKLPSTYSTEDVVYNMARISTWIKYLKTGKFEHLRLALEDRVHTPYRIKNESFLQRAVEVGMQLGACYSLSGSGPTLLFYIPQKLAKDFAKQFDELMKNHPEPNRNYKIFPIDVCNSGTLVKDI